MTWERGRPGRMGFNSTGFVVGEKRLRAKRPRSRGQG
jgi:hypothetical protein